MSSLLLKKSTNLIPDVNAIVKVNVNVNVIVQEIVNENERTYSCWVVEIWVDLQQQMVRQHHRKKSIN